MSGFIYTPPVQQLAQALYSLCLGVGIGLIYTFFDTIYITLDLYIDLKAEKCCKYQSSVKKKIIISKIFQFSIDFLFSIVYTIIIVVFVFCANNGKFRFFMFFFAVMGFVLYRVTLGRLISFVMQKLVFALRRFICYRIAAPLIGAAQCLIGFLVIRHTSRTIERGIIDTVRKDGEF